jgi:hypothetical protein
VLRFQYPDDRRPYPDPAFLAYYGALWRGYDRDVVLFADVGNMLFKAFVGVGR